MDDDYVSVAEGARRVGCSHVTLGRLIDAGELPAFRPLTDRRRRLVRVSDLEALRTPQPVGAKGGAMTTTA